MATVVPAPTIPIRIPIRPLLFSASLHHSTERDVCKAVSAQAEQAAQVDALSLEGGQVEHAAEQQAGQGGGESLQARRGGAPGTEG